MTISNAEIVYTRSTNGGSTFDNIVKNLSSSTLDSIQPAIAVSGNNVHVVWADNILGGFDIFYTTSTDGGNTFSNMIKNLSDHSGDSFSPDISILDSNVYVVWKDIRSGNFEILYKTSTDDGINFIDTVSNLSTNAGASESPVIAVSNLS